MKKTTKKVISFSLYGTHPEYTLGAVDNLRHARWFFPDWVCRFYVADNVPRSIVARLIDNGAEVVKMGQYLEYEASLWRFLVAVDPEVDISIVRDTDSRFSKYELMMVNEWLASGKKFHVMYPFNANCPIMAGMWGVRGVVPELRELLENFLKSPDVPGKGADQTFLHHSLYPLTKGNVHIHEAVLNAKQRNFGQRKFYVGEPTKPFNSFRGDQWYIRLGGPRRVFLALSIYKNTPLYEYFLAELIGIIEDRNLSCLIVDRTLETFYVKFQFYVADDIRPDLVERLRRLGQVILKPAETVYEDEPLYWKLSILSKKNLGLAMIIGFWEFFILARTSRQGFGIRYAPYNTLPTGIKSRFRSFDPLTVCGPDVPVAQIDELIAQRNPNESYQEFVRSTLYPRIATVTETMILNAHPLNVGALKGWIILLCPPVLYDAVSRAREFLKNLF